MRPLNAKPLFLTLLVLGGVLAYVDHVLKLDTLLVEGIHALVVTGVLVFCIVCQIRNPEIKRFGWTAIILGLVCLTIGSWVDLLDDPISLHWVTLYGVPFGRTWEQAFLKKIVGYAGGILLIAYGFSQWIPWMIQSRQNMERLNERLSQANQESRRALISRDEHVEAERLNIARELHDDVAQQLTFLSVQLQLCQKEMTALPESALSRLSTARTDISSVLKHIRQLSRDLRPEALYALGFFAALEQFIEKQRLAYPATQFVFQTDVLPGADHTRLEMILGDREQLHLFRIVQEGIRNAIKHSQAKSIQIFLTETSKTYRIVIQDDGIGLPWAGPMPGDVELIQEGHLGIVGLKERVAEIGAVFNLQNESPAGTRLKIELNK